MDSHDYNVNLLLPNQSPEIPECGIQRSLGRDVPLGCTLRLDEVGIDVVGPVVMAFLLQSNTREVVRPDVLVSRMVSGWTNRY